jgi:hypothetical protein
VPRDKRVADESVVAERVRTTQPYRSEGALLYLRSFDEGEAGEDDKDFHRVAGAEAKDIQQSEDRTSAGSGGVGKRFTVNEVHTRITGYAIST